MAIVYSRQFQVDIRCPLTKEPHTLTSTENNVNLKRRRRNSGPSEWWTFGMAGRYLCIFDLHGATYIVIFLVTSSSTFSELSLVGLALDVAD